MILNKKEICNILNITLEALKKIEKNNKLETRLKEKGYKLISRYKEGRKVLYNIKQENKAQELYSNLIKYIYKTNKAQEFGRYFTLRTKADIILNKKDIAENSTVSNRTVTKWDNILLKNDIISKDDFFYFCIEENQGNKIIRECSKEEYKNFFKNKAYKEAFKNLQDKYINGEITLNELTLASAEVGAIMQALENKYYYRINKYKTNKNNKLYLDTSELIKILYRYGDLDTIYSQDIKELL